MARIWPLSVVDGDQRALDERRLLERHRRRARLVERADAHFDQIAGMHQIGGVRPPRPRESRSARASPCSGRTAPAPCGLPLSRALDGGDDRRDDVAGGDRPRPAIVLEAVERLALGQDVARRLAPEAAALVDCAQAVVDGAVGRALQLDVERGLHGQAVLVERLGAVAGPRGTCAPLRGSTARSTNPAPARRASTIGCRFAASATSRRDVALVGHALERVVAPAPRRVHVDVRALAHVALDDAGDERRFLEREIARRLAEVQLRRRLDAVGAVAPSRSGCSRCVKISSLV